MGVPATMDAYEKAVVGLGLLDFTDEAVVVAVAALPGCGLAFRADCGEELEPGVGGGE